LNSTFNNPFCENLFTVIKYTTQNSRKSVYNMIKLSRIGQEDKYISAFTVIEIENKLNKTRNALELNKYFPNWKEL
jgi:hypothetical protein